jgi:hypothetical protein
MAILGHEGFEGEELRLATEFIFVPETDLLEMSSGEIGS